MEREKLMELLIQNGIKDPENPTTKDILKLLELESENKLDNTLIKEYFQYVGTAVPKLFDTLQSYASQHVSKDYMKSLDKRIDTLNEAFNNAKTEEERNKNHEEVHKIFQEMKEESREQRNWILKLAMGTLGTLAILGGFAIGVRNKEAGKKIVEEGIKVIKGKG
ncbi:hypothetical protein [Cytobacillus praedii]|uniref:hypothetical protein n=1 Tax=Cytobacillus praedii TaxID=1742358 RepID=UPI002E1FD39B|nr:hypothetical protein [Cytobacillus praedii]